jgi:uncharacterized damage-inducible protein DinB
MPEPTLPRELSREWEALVRGPDAGPAFRPGGPPFPTTAAGLFAELEEVLLLWRELRAQPLERHARRFVNAAWTLQDLLAHLASWAGEFRREVDTLAEGREIDYAIPFALSVIGPNEWNEAEVERRKALSLADVLDQFEEETRRLQDVVLTLSPAQILETATLPAAPGGHPESRIKGNIAIVVSGKCTHDRYHIGQIRQRVAALEGGRRRITKKKE